MRQNRNRLQNLYMNRTILSRPQQGYKYRQNVQLDKFFEKVGIVLFAPYQNFGDGAYYFHALFGTLVLVLFLEDCQLVVDVVERGLVVAWTISVPLHVYIYVTSIDVYIKRFAKLVPTAHYKMEPHQLKLPSPKITSRSRPRTSDMFRAQRASSNRSYLSKQRNFAKAIHDSSLFADICMELFPENPEVYKLTPVVQPLSPSRYETDFHSFLQAKQYREATVRRPATALRVRSPTRR
jgi:hypothetical protein